MFNRIFLVLILILLSSCSVLKRKGNWGRRAIWPLKGSSFLNAATNNASSPHFWGPLIGAGAIHWGGYDHKISNWASRESSIFKNREQADNWSDHFNNIMKYEMYASIIFTPSMDEDESLTKYAIAKAKGAVVVNVASTSTRYTRDRLAKAVHRRRPNSLDYKSFPSGHATEASSRNTLISKNLDSIEMNPNLRFGIKTVNTTMAAGTLWARLEGKRHYPSDVLVGYALGSFLSGFIYDSFMNLEEGEIFTIYPSGNEIKAQYSLVF